MIYYYSTCEDWENLNLHGKKLTDVNAESREMFELFDEDFKSAIIKMFKHGRTLLKGKKFSTKKEKIQRIIKYYN